MVTLGTLYVISAASGTGKTSLVKRLTETMENVMVSISYTTRPRRQGEKEEVDYHFVNEEKFKDMIRHDMFLEYARVYDRHFYGTSRPWVEEKLTSGMGVILEIDWQGAVQIRQKFPDCVSVYILPPNLQSLEDRLRARGKDDDDVIAFRMKHACQEMSHYVDYDYLVVNDDFDVALQDLQAIIQARRLTTSRQQMRYGQLLAQLLKR